MIKVGQELKLKPSVFKGMLFSGEALPCKVVYVNRRHRYFTAEFTCPGGKFRESFRYTANEPGVMRIFAEGGS